MILSTKTKIAAARVAHDVITLARKTVRLSNQVVVRRNGCQWALDIDEGIDLSIYLLGMFERRTVNACLDLIRPGDVAIDIGANIGAYTLHLAKAVGPQGLVVAFEATQYAFAKLQRNLRLNPDQDRVVRAEHIILGDQVGRRRTQSFYASWPLRKSMDLHAKHCGMLMGAGDARTTTLDAYLEEAGIEKCALIKLDVDGHECSVLRGGKKTFARSRPFLVMELAPYVLTEAGGSVEELVDLLDGLGYGLTGLFDSKPLPKDPPAIRAMIPDGCSINILARPIASRQSPRYGGAI